MNVVYLSPQFPPQYHQFCGALKRAGANVLGIADTPHDQLAHDVRQALTEYYRVDDMHDYDALVRACGYFTHRYGKLDRFESLNEYWLDTEARIRDDFNIFGVREQSIGFIRRKSLMKEQFRMAGIPVATGGVVRTREEADALIEETGYPVVAKPDAGVGALNTCRIDNETQLNTFFETKPDVDYIMEAFISGTIYSFDGLADRNGQIVFQTAHTFSQGIMETVNEARHISYYSLRQIPPGLEAVGRRCVETFDVRERFFHIEFFETAPEAFTALEVNMRPPGGYTTDMFNYACDFDVYRTWADLIVNNHRDVVYERKYHCCYASRKNHLNYRHSHEDILERFSGQMVQTVHVPGVFSSALGDIGYIFRDPDLGIIQEITAYIHAFG